MYSDTDSRNHGVPSRFAALAADMGFEFHALILLVAGGHNLPLLQLSEHWFTSNRGLRPRVNQVKLMLQNGDELLAGSICRHSPS